MSPFNVKKVSTPVDTTAEDTLVACVAWVVFLTVLAAKALT